MNSKHKEILELSVAEKILLVEEIWDSIISEDSAEITTLSDPQKLELMRRLNLHRKGQTQTYSWKEVKSSLKT